jgi:chemotaxis response regulator CheB
MSLNAGDAVRKAVLIVGASVFVRHALYELFTRQSDFEVCGVAENGREAVEVASQLHPDLVVLDLSMPVTNGLDVARALKRVLPTVLIIMYSAVSHHCLTVGASGLPTQSLSSSGWRNYGRSSYRRNQG